MQQPAAAKTKKSTRRAAAPKKAELDKALLALETENAELKSELEDIKLLYEATIEHGEAIEDQLAEQAAQLETQTTQLEKLSQKLAKYLSPQVYQSIFEGRQEVEITSTRKKLTVFFSDIADFTETADRLESEELTSLLNHYLTEMSLIAMNYGATIDKYVGDAIMIFFGDPETLGVEEDALACVRMALEMQQRMSELQTVWRERGISKPLRCRMGIHTDYCTVGNFGSDDRLDYTIIGSGVNTAARLESLAEPGSILISFETFSQVKEYIDCRENGEVPVKGIAYPVSTYKVLRERDEENTAVSERVQSLSDQLDTLISGQDTTLAPDERTDLIASLEAALSRLNHGTS